MSILGKAIESGVNSIDLELSIGDKARSTLVEQATSAKVNIISSIHNTTTTPSAEELVNMVNEHAKDGEIFKFCGTVNDHQDALQIVEASHELKTTLHAYSMMALGNGGDWARLHARSWANLWSTPPCAQNSSCPTRDSSTFEISKNAWALMEY